MTAQEAIKLLKAMREAGVTHFQAPGWDVQLGCHLKPLEGPISPSEPPPLPTPTPPPLQENLEATERAKQVIAQLRMSDQDLVNKIFPEGAM